MLTGASLAILLFANDIALFSYSATGMQKQLDILNRFCVRRGLTVNVQKTKILVFEPQSSSAASFNGDIIEHEFKTWGSLMHCTKGLSPAIEYQKIHVWSATKMFTAADS